MAEGQNKDFKMAIVNMFKELKENMNKSINQIYESTMKWDGENW